MKSPDRRSLKLLALPLFGLALAAAPASAEIIGLEPFDYSDGFLEGLDGGTGWDYLRNAEPDAEPQSPSDWNNVTAEPEVVGGALVTSGSAAKREYGGLTEGSGAGSNEREGAFRGEGVVYIAVDYSVDAMLPGGTNQWGGFSSYDFGTERLFFGLPSQSTETRYFGVTGTALGTTALSTIAVEPGVQYRLIGAVDFDNDLVKLWVNPDAGDFDEGAEHSADVAAAYTGTNWASAVRLGSGAGFSVTWDNLAVADTLADLLPEPSGVVFRRVTLTAVGLTVELSDEAGAQFDPNRPVTATVDGQSIAVTATKTGADGLLTYTTTLPALFANGTHQVTITARDTANNPIAFDGPVTTRAYEQLDAAWQAPAGEVNTGETGFQAAVHQLAFSRYPESEANVLPQPERQIGLGYADRRTGAVAPNLADPGSGPGGVYFVDGGIDWDIDTGNGAFPGEPFPGIPGVTGTTTHAVVECFAWLELPAGLTRFGVNSDDGFLVTSGAAPLDLLTRKTLGVFDGGRGAADSIFDVVAPVAGVYPVRLLWWQGTGGAALEFFTLKDDGTKLLVGDTSEPDAIKAWRSGRAAVPSLHAIAPYPGSTENGALQPVRIEIVDGIAALNDASVTLTVDGVAVTPDISREVSGRAVIALPPPGGAWAYLSTHEVSLTYSDTAGSPRSETWTFSVGVDPTALIGIEPFDYEDGFIDLLDGGTGWDYVRSTEPDSEPSAPSNWNNVTADSLVIDGQLVTSGSSAKREFSGPTEGSGAGANEREGAFRGAGVVYFGVDYRVDFLLDEGTNQWSGFSSYDFGTERIFFGMPGQSTGVRFFGVTGTALAGPVYSEIPVETDRTYRLVGAVDFDADLVKLWVDPDASDYDYGADHTADATSPYTGTNWSSAVRLGSGAGFETTWDNLVVAQQFADTFAAGTPAAGLALLNYNFDRTTGTLELEWSSTPGESYGIQFSRDLSGWTTLVGNIPAAAGASTSYQAALGSLGGAPDPGVEGRLYFRVRTAD